RIARAGDSDRDRLRRTRRQDADDVPSGRVQHVGQSRRPQSRLEFQLRPARRLSGYAGGAIMSAASKIDDDCVLVITRDFDAPRALVWQAWIDFNHAQHWMGPAGHPMKSMDHDLRVGGHWRNVMRHEGKDLPQSGVYREIKAPELLSFTF